MSKAIRVLKGVQGFLAYCAARNDSPNTLRSYNRDLLQFVQFVGQDAKTTDLNRKMIRNYMMALGGNGLKCSSIRRKLAAIKSFCVWLARENYAETNPAEDIRGPRPHDELPDVPSEKDMRRLLTGPIPTACPERDRVILELLYGSGLRASELAAINLEDFRDAKTLLVHAKGRKERLVPVGKHARNAIRQWLPVRQKLLEKQRFKTDALLMSVGPHESWERLDVRSIHRAVSQTAQAKGLPSYHPHLLRHACATHMHDHGAPIQVIAAMLGHARLSTAQLYTRVSVGRMMQTYRNAHPHVVKANEQCSRARAGHSTRASHTEPQTLPHSLAHRETRAVCAGPPALAVDAQA